MPITTIILTSFFVLVTVDFMVCSYLLSRHIS